MKILVLMPLQQQSADFAAALYEALPENIKEVTFPMPTYMEYLVITKQTPNYTYSLFDTIYSAERLCDAAEKENLDLMIFGNVNKKYKFDKIFNFQDIDAALLYEDKFIEKIKTIVNEEDNLIKMLNSLHTAEESTMSLTNCDAAGKFLGAYMETDPHLEKIEEEYRKKVGESNAKN